MPTMYCNPDVCPSCQYIGEGDSLCDKTGEIVLADWEPTEHFMGRGSPYKKKTRRKKKRIGAIIGFAEVAPDEAV